MQPPLDPATAMPDVPQADTGSNSYTWDPTTISNIIFSAIMVFIGIIAIWQAHQAHRRSTRVLDQEELIGMQPLSRASTTLSTDSYAVEPNQSTLPSSGRAVSRIGDAEDVGELVPDGAAVAA